ncbi:MAG: hypothetical protein F4X65_11050 [Chloroflexi bacterium]|nr:hypothetical protein [Chloroflexota bacterium]
MLKFTRKRVFLMLAVGALALGLAGGTAVAVTASGVHAHGGIGWGSGSDGTSFASRVAAKLNDALDLDEDITEAQVQTAFNGATADRQVEALEARLDDLEVEESVKTGITDWFDEYPYNDLIRLRPIGLAESDRVSSHLERLVEKERITQAQSDAIQSWYDDRPDLPQGLERAGRGHHRSRGGDSDGDGANASFHGRHGRGGDGVGSFFRGRFGGRDGGTNGGTNGGGDPL